MIRTTRRDTNPYARVDVAPELQAVLAKNGMQAHITEDANGNYKLMTLAHNTSQPRYYDLTKQQLDALVSGGSDYFNKEAYRAFVGIVRNDYYVPAAYVYAKNAYSPVNSGIYGYRAQVGEYGYTGFPGYRRPGFFGRMFDGMLHNQGWGPGMPHYRRIGNRLFLDNGAPIMAERPDGTLKPGEMQSGAYGFYDKGNQQPKGKDVLQELKVEPPKLNKLSEEEKRKVETLKGLTDYNKGWMTTKSFNSMLASHGVYLDQAGKKLKIHARDLDRDFVYDLTADQAKVVFNPKIKMQDKKGKIINKDGSSVNERLATINYVIGQDFRDKITPEMLNEKDLVHMELKDNVKQELGLDKSNVQQSGVQGQSSTIDVIDLKKVREDYRSGFIDSWRSIGVVDGRALNKNEGFYIPVNGGRRVSVGEIQAYAANDGNDRGQTYKMSAVINGKVFTHEISKQDYEKFLNYDDEYRLKLFDKNFKEVQIKSARNGQMEDAVRSDMLGNADSSTSLRGRFSFVIDGEATTITAATAWKDEVSQDYVLNVRDGKDAGVWTIKLTEQQYLAFRDASQMEKGKMVGTLMPWREDLKGKVKVMPTQLLSASERVESALNGNLPRISEKTLRELKATKGVKEVTPVLTVKDEMKMADGMKKVLQERGEWVKPQQGRLVNGENLNLDEIREQTRKNLQGLASVNGESLENIKDSKNWKRSGEHGRDTTVGDITVDKMRDKDGNVVDGKYRMSAVIDGVVVTHEINQKQFDKFLLVDNYQRMKLFDKVFPEVQMKTKEGRGLHLGAAILAALTVGTDLALALTSGPRPSRPKPDVYADVYSKPGVVSAGAVARNLYEDKMQNDMDRAVQSMGRGL